MCVLPEWRNSKRDGLGRRYPLREGFVSASLTSGTPFVNS